MSKKKYPDTSVSSSLLNEPAVAYETVFSALNLPKKYFVGLSADEIEDLSHCITGEELEERIIGRLEKKFAVKQCK